MTTPKIELRDLLAAHAPPTPDWFEVPADVPDPPDESDMVRPETEVVRHVAAGEYDATDDALRSAGVRPERFERVRSAARMRAAYYAARDHAHRKARHDRAFAWPWHYADRVLGLRGR